MAKSLRERIRCTSSSCPAGHHFCGVRAGTCQSEGALLFCCPWLEYSNAFPIMKIGSWGVAYRGGNRHMVE